MIFKYTLLYKKYRILEDIYEKRVEINTIR